MGLDIVSTDSVIVSVFHSVRNDAMPVVLSLLRLTRRSYQTNLNGHFFLPAEESSVRWATPSKAEYAVGPCKDWTYKLSSKQHRDNVNSKHSQVRPDYSSAIRVERRGFELE